MSCLCINKITFVGNEIVGDSLLNPYNAEWLFAANKYHDFDCISTSDGVNYYIHTNIEIGDGVNPTYFKDLGKNFIFDQGKDFILNPPAYLESTGVWTQSEKELLFSKIDEIPNEVSNVTIEESFDLTEALRIILAATAGSSSGAGTNSFEYKSVDGNKTRIRSSFDVNGNRQITLLDAS